MMLAIVYSAGIRNFDLKTMIRQVRTRRTAGGGGASDEGLAVLGRPLRRQTHGAGAPLCAQTLISDIRTLGRELSPSSL